MAAYGYREVGDYIINMDGRECLGKTIKVVVYPGKHKTGDTKVAGKLYVWDKDLPTDMVDEEVANMRAIPPHDNILKLVDYVKVVQGKYKELWLILELCALGDLGKFAEGHPLSLPQKVDLMLQAASGVQHLHHMERPMIHRNLKPTNLLVTSSPLHPLVKVAAFGEATYFQGSKESDVHRMIAAGTPYYQAPELFSDPKRNMPEYNKAVDTFALGVSFLYLLDAEQGVRGTPIKVEKEVLGQHLHKHPDTDVCELVMKRSDSDDVKKVKKLICEMLARKHASRPLIDAVVERLHELRTLLGVKVLAAVDTVWKKPIFYLDTNQLRTFKSSQTTDPEEPEVTTESPLPKGAMRMENVRNVTSAVRGLGLLD